MDYCWIWRFNNNDFCQSSQKLHAQYNILDANRLKVVLSRMTLNTHWYSCWQNRHELAFSNVAKPLVGAVTFICLKSSRLHCCRYSLLPALLILRWFSSITVIFFLKIFSIISDRLLKNLILKCLSSIRMLGLILIFSNIL